VEIYCRAGQATDDNMVHVLGMLDTYGYKYTQRLCNTRNHCLPLQQWLNEGASMLHYTYIAYLVLFFVLDNVVGIRVTYKIYF
jgi:hypothetical protein